MLSTNQLTTGSEARMVLFNRMVEDMEEVVGS